MESTQEGEATACRLVKEAVLCQMLQHLLAVHSETSGEDVILLADGSREARTTLPDEEETPRMEGPDVGNASRTIEDPDGSQRSPACSTIHTKA